MKPLLCSVAALLAVTSVGLRAQTLVHVYEFNDASDSTTGLPISLVTNGGNFVDNPGFYSFSENQGFSFSGETALKQIYTVAVRFTLLSGTVDYFKLIDFADRNGGDAGLYAHRAAGNNFQFWSSDDLVGESAVSSWPGFGVSQDVVFTRNSGGTVAVYVGGSPLFSFDDSVSNSAVANALVESARFWFFVDDLAHTGSEAAAGKIDRLLIYDDALSAGQVPNAFSAIPEPSSVAVVMGMFALGALFGRRRFRALPGGGRSVSPRQ